MHEWKHSFQSLSGRLGGLVLAAGLLVTFAVETSQSALLGMALSLLAAWATQWVVSLALQPIDALVETARRISRGDESAAIPALPSAQDELARLTHSFREMKERLDDRADRLVSSQQQVAETNERLRIQNDELQRVNEVLEQLSITDGLTKLHNHRFFQEFLAREVKRADRSNEPLSLILIDIDHFKTWNDKLGHAAGDEILRRVAEVMNDVIRDTDLLARYGGEEFALIVPNTTYEGALALAEKIRSSIAETRFLLVPPSEDTRLTVSVGVAFYDGDRASLFNDADRALYSAKERGRDCVVAADET